VSSERGAIYHAERFIRDELLRGRGKRRAPTWRTTLKLKPIPLAAGGHRRLWPAELNPHSDMISCSAQRQVRPDAKTLTATFQDRGRDSVSLWDLGLKVRLLVRSLEELRAGGEQRHAIENVAHRSAVIAGDEGCSSCFQTPVSVRCVRGHEE